MDFLWSLYDTLFEYEVYIVFLIALILFLVIRGSDLFRWIGRKIRGNKKSAEKPNS